MNWKQNILVFTMLFMAYLPLWSQQADSARLTQFENNVKYMAENMVKIPHEKARLAACKELRDSLGEVLYLESSFLYPFDSLKSIKIIKSEDEKVRLYSFTVILNNEQHHNYCFLQYKLKGGGVDWLLLEDTSVAYPSEHLMAELYPNEWVGAVYYGIQTLKTKKGKMYFLTGYSGADKRINYKVIDVLRYNKEEESWVFGAPMFKLHQNDYEPQYRYILEYANDANCVTRFEETKKSHMKLIVFSNLEPQHYSLKGSTADYYPEGTYDFFLWEKKKWVRNKHLRYFDFKGNEQ